MLSDPKYVDNIVMQKEALQELLTNIKNYPVIDIDYVTEEETDDRNTDLNIWQEYTGGSPCIRIKYGDEYSTKGNIIFAEVFKKLKIKAELKLKELENQKTAYSNEYDKWNQVYNINKDIYTLRQNTLDSLATLYATAAYAQAANIVDPLVELSNTYQNQFEPFWTNGSPITRPTFTKQNIVIASITKPYPILALEERTDMITRLQNEQTAYGASSTTVYNSYSAIITDIRDYPKYELLGTTAVFNTNDITQMTPAQIKTALENYADGVVKSAKTKRDNAQIIMNNFKGMVNNSTTQINRLEVMLTKCDQLIDSIADGTSKINNSSNNIQALNGTTKSFSATVNGQAVTATAYNAATFINAVIVGATTLKNGDVTAADNTGKTMYGYKYVKVGSNITFDNNLQSDNQKYGTFIITINGNDTTVPIKGFESSSVNNILANTNILPSSTTGGINLGSSGHYWENGYIQNLLPNTTTASTTGSAVGSPAHPYVTGYFNQIKIGDVTIGGSGGTGDSSKFLRGDGTWSNELSGSLLITGTNDGTTGTYAGNATTGNTAASIRTNGGIYAVKNIWAAKTFNAVFNDYAECRQTIMIAPGYTVIDQDNGTMILSSERLQPGAQIVSDTYGHLMGMTEEAKTPIAVAGRVLAYTYRPREEYHAGMAVCSAPGGTIDIMTREEIKEYPDCIVGIVSEIPNYEIWGSENIKVNGRIWIKVR